jgi:HK97 family phage portal protein
MNLLDSFKNIFAKRQVAPPQHEQHGVTYWSPSDVTGAYVSHESRATESTYGSAKSLIGDALAILPPQVMVARSDNPDDGNERMRGHPVEDMLNQPNAEMTGPTFKQLAIDQAHDGGNFFAEIERDGTGKPVALWPIGYGRVEAVRDNAGALFFRIDNGSAGKVDLAAADTFHLRGPWGFGPLGTPVVTHYRNTIDHAVRLRTFGSNWLGNSGAPSGILKVKHNITHDGLKQLKEEFTSRHTGPRKAGKVVFTDAEAEWQQMGLSMLDSEFLAQRRFSVEEVARIMHVPPQLLGDNSKSTFNNFETAGLHFLTYALMPWILRFETEANRKLFRPTAGRRKPFLKLNAAAIVRGDLEKRNRSYALGRQWGWLSVNDIRRLEDLTPIGPEGDVYLQPMNMEPAGNEPAQSDDDTVSQLAAHLRRAAE